MRLSSYLISYQGIRSRNPEARIQDDDEMTLEQLIDDGIHRTVMGAAELVACLAEFPEEAVAAPLTMFELETELLETVRGWFERKTRLYEQEAIENISGVELPSG
jgi:hypothetical protein